MCQSRCLFCSLYCLHSYKREDLLMALVLIEVTDTLLNLSFFWQNKDRLFSYRITDRLSSFYLRKCMYVHNTCIDTYRKYGQLSPWRKGLSSCTYTLPSALPKKVTRHVCSISLRWSLMQPRLFTKSRKAIHLYICVYRIRGQKKLKRFFFYFGYF